VVPKSVVQSASQGFLGCDFLARHQVVPVTAKRLLLGSSTLVDCPSKILLWADYCYVGGHDPDQLIIAENPIDIRCFWSSRHDAIRRPAIVRGGPERRELAVILALHISIKLGQGIKVDPSNNLLDCC
jgi:hypothetical protein